MKKEYIIPIFVPHLGCPNQCTFCNQKKISGQLKKVTAKDVEETIEYYLKNFKDKNKYVEVAFFGGSFTAIDEKEQEELLNAAYKYIKNKKVNSIRISTRPDCINEDIAKLQQTYIETTGRNKLFSRRDNRSITALGEYLGDDGLAANYTAEMEIFNAGVAGSVDMLDKVLQDVNRIGLNGRKYTKTLVDSLKLAQKYNFKGGTENLMKMAKWAENTRFNMNSLGGMLDKISEGGLEGIITQGAQFQVLGGQAAMNADPFAMMFERYADPEAFAKRMQDMTKGYGSLDRITGETTFSGTEQMLMEQLAKIQGRSVEDVMNEVRARNKREVVSKQLNGNFDEDEQSYISNVATYNKKTRQFEVKVQGKNGQYENKEVSQLTKEDLENLMPEKHDERMEDYMQTIVDLLL